MAKRSRRGQNQAIKGWTGTRDQRLIYLLRRPVAWTSMIPPPAYGGTQHLPGPMICTLGARVLPAHNNARRLEWTCFIEWQSATIPSFSRPYM